MTFDTIIRGGTVATASDTYIAALYAHNLAKASLARALGIAESAVTTYLGGGRQ